MALFTYVTDALSLQVLLQMASDAARDFAPTH
jgi:hypothetical protein